MFWVVSPRKWWSCRGQPGAGFAVRCFVGSDVWCMTKKGCLRAKQIFLQSSKLLVVFCVACWSKAKGPHGGLESTPNLEKTMRRRHNPVRQKVHAPHAFAVNFGTRFLSRFPLTHLLFLDEIKHDRVMVSQRDVPGKGRRHFGRRHLFSCFRLHAHGRP